MSKLDRDLFEEFHKLIDKMVSTRTGELVDRKDLVGSIYVHTLLDVEAAIDKQIAIWQEKANG